MHEATNILATSFLRPSKQLTIDTKDYNTKFALRQTRRSDSGEYTITAENSSGKDQVTVRVTVTDKPGKPEGPLDVSTGRKIWRGKSVGRFLERWL